MISTTRDSDTDKIQDASENPRSRPSHVRNAPAVAQMHRLTATQYTVAYNSSLYIMIPSSRKQWRKCQAQNGNQ